MGCLKLNIENPTLLRVLNGGKLEFTKKCVDTSRFAYNGMEVDPEIKGDGNSYTTEFRQYDPRLGRWLSLDPLMEHFPNMSPYVAFDNNPIFYTDINGDESSSERPPHNRIIYGFNTQDIIQNWLAIHIRILFNTKVREAYSYAKSIDGAVFIKRYDKTIKQHLKLGGQFVVNEFPNLTEWQYSIFASGKEDDENEEKSRKKNRMHHSNNEKKLKWGFVFSIEGGGNGDFHLFSFGLGRHIRSHNMFFVKRCTPLNFNQNSFTPLIGIKWKTKSGAYNWVYFGTALAWKGKPLSFVWDLSKRNRNHKKSHSKMDLHIRRRENWGKKRYKHI